MAKVHCEDIMQHWDETAGHSDGERRAMMGYHSSVLRTRRWILTSWFNTVMPQQSTGSSHSTFDITIVVWCHNWASQCYRRILMTQWSILVSQRGMAQWRIWCDIHIVIEKYCSRCLPWWQGDMCHCLTPAWDQPQRRRKQGEVKSLKYLLLWQKYSRKPT